MRLFNKFNWFKIFVGKQNSCNIKTLRYDKVRDLVSNGFWILSFLQTNFKNKKYNFFYTKHGLKINSYLIKIIIKNLIFKI